MAEKEEKKVEAPPDSGWPEYDVKVQMEKKPIVAPDGHVVLSQEDIDSRG